MWLAPPVVASIGAGIGITICTVWLWRSAREQSLDTKLLSTLAGSALFAFVILAYVQVGFGSLFGLPLSELLGFDLSGDPNHIRNRHPSLLFAMWASLAASIELLLVLAWLRLRR